MLSADGSANSEQKDRRRHHQPLAQRTEVRPRPATPSGAVAANGNSSTNRQEALQRCAPTFVPGLLKKL